MRFIFWLRYMVKTAAFHLYRGLFSPGCLALSSQPGTDQPDPQPAPPVSLAVPLLKAPLQSLSSQGFQPQMDIQNLQVPTPGISELDITMPGQTFDITLIPITPLEVNRYGRNVLVKDEYEAFLVEKGPLDCSEELAPVAGWEPLTQPEGAMIFYQPYKVHLTPAMNPHIRVKIDKAVEKVYHEARNASIPLDPFVGLGLELIVKDGKEMWGYYFVDHAKWVERKSHIKYALESQYWRHIELFPNRRFLPEDIVVELKELVMYTQADSITSPTSIVHFTPDEITSIFSLIYVTCNIIDLLASELIPVCGIVIDHLFSQQELQAFHVDHR
ncbi:uncharacterized protein F5147DRAFT_689474 [Suillus discolor]|uniref:Uncharacterized protein n=1 Tax=Suillus discolor TaxID=1912936 RepID=A0A9P7FB64_9AGAM|nr:uncharacterized protein F5147DRAFT_689474 [Suillus discolor]KAG2110644.1 hypothetical protein F5147DRAFT_689474 [Suillus discolor]